MATGTIAPVGKHQFFDDNGDPLSGGKLYTYAAGTSTPLATYSDVGLTTPNDNPVVIDAAGRCTLFLTASSYKWVLKTSADVTVWTQDNIGAVPNTNVDLDVTGTAGEALTAGNVVYLSDGSGALTAGRWYKTDADLSYASVDPMVGMVPADIASGEAGSIRLQGRMTGLSGLTIGIKYYVSGTAGALATTPTGRFVGVADSITSLILTPNPIRITNQPLGICEGRLTATTAVPVTTADVSGATSIFYTPYTGNRIALYDGAAGWLVKTFSEITISLAGLTASKPYDIFAYDNAGTVAIETLVWTNETTRATALTKQDGVLVKTGATTRRYLGTVYINASGGQTDDTFVKRYLWNYYHQRPRAMRRLETTASWTYTTATWRQANNSTSNQLDFVLGVAEIGVDAVVHATAQNTTNASVQMSVGVGLSDTTTPATGSLRGTSESYVAGQWVQMTARCTTFPPEGRSRLTWLEWSEASGTTSWAGASDPAQSGISAVIWG